MKIIVGVQSVENVILTGFLSGKDDDSNSKRLTGGGDGLYPTLEMYGRRQRNGHQLLYQSRIDGRWYLLKVGLPMDKKNVNSVTQV